MQRISPEAARALFAECGGPQKVAERLGISKRAAAFAHTRGITWKYALAVKAAFPAAYARWAKAQLVKEAA